ncbi:MAG: aminotransferase class I/II-fold pyridoxal phosphate-dependent enzyme [Desulfovibrio sp.]|jgi:cystathionine beta-lyase|nr:aminotransferase class I/II-fold pyridoxal phosphate-dependent enzyme [Desulfovibrio sp.]
MRKETVIIHGGMDRDPHTGASGVPQYLSSTYHQEDVLDHQGYDYARSGNPTREALEKAVAGLEGGAGASAFASGIAAVAAAFILLRPGDHILLPRAVYGGTYRLLNTIFARWGLGHDFVDFTDPDAVRRAVTPATRVLFLETPSNPLLKIIDLRAMVAIARERDLMTMADNTFASPWLQRPLELGFDLVLHSATKFLNGHSDVLGGLAVARTPELAERIYFIQNAMGAVLGVSDSWLVLRGLRTLAVRMEASQKSAQTLAETLSTWPQIRKVYYPGLPRHPGRDIHFSQASGAGAVISFELADKESARNFLRRVRLPLVGVSLGGVESILSYPATMSHAAMPEAERRAQGVTDGLIRLSVGLESPDDLLEDFRQALAGE